MGAGYNGFVSVADPATLQTASTESTNPLWRKKMAEKKDTVRIELTEEQKKQIRERTGKDAKAIELTAEELEERVSPRMAQGPGGGLA